MPTLTLTLAQALSFGETGCRAARIHSDRRPAQHVVLLFLHYMRARLTMVTLYDGEYFKVLENAAASVPHT
jgi:hypothetical protein